MGVCMGPGIQERDKSRGLGGIRLCPERRRNIEGGQWERGHFSGGTNHLNQYRTENNTITNIHWVFKLCEALCHIFDMYYLIYSPQIGIVTVLVLVLRKEDTGLSRVTKLVKRQRLESIRQLYLQRRGEAGPSVARGLCCVQVLNSDSL